MMGRHTCSHEPDVLDAVAARRMDAVLAAHVKTCAVCQDAAEVAGALFSDHYDALSEAAVPSAQAVWVRAQMRARAEAARVASRPVLIVQAIGVVCATAAVVGVIGTIAWWLRSWASWLSSAATVIASAPATADVIGLAMRGALLAISVWLVLAPVAVYLAATDD
jgi:hypothetical protein